MGGENLSGQTKWNRKFSSRDKFDLNTSSDDFYEPEGEKITKTDQRKTESVDATNVQDEVEKEEKITTDENVNLLMKDSSEEKTTPVPVSPELKLIIEQNPFLLCNLELSLSEKQYCFQEDPLFSDSDSFQHFLVRFIEKGPIIKVNHVKKEQGYLKENLDEWKSFIDSYQNESVIIYTDDNFSKTYIFGSSTSDSKRIKSNIAKFLNPNPVTVNITPHVLEFITQNDKFSDVKCSKPDKKGNCRCTLTELRFAKLKEEMNKVTCQSFLLDEIQYESLSGDKKDFLLEVENKFNVKGTIYEYKRTAEIPVIFVVNSLTRISCVVSTDPEEIPLDSLITIDWKQQSEGGKQLTMNKKPNYTILQYLSWNIAVNHYIGVVASEMRTKSYPWNRIMEYCLEIVFKNDSDSKTIGISIPAEISADLPEFCQSVWTVVENLPQNHERPIYILLFVKNDKMKQEIIELMKKISAPKPKVPLNVTNNQCVVDVISGLITEVKADAITCSVNADLILSNGGVAKAILQKVGRQIQTDCSKNNQHGIIFPELAITKGYNLPCKYIFFGALPNNDGRQPNISTFVETCLENAVSNRLTSIAFPALGTGNLNYEPRNVAAEMESTIKKFMAKKESNTLQKILIVIHPTTKKMEPFFEMKKKFDNESKGAIAKRRVEGPQANEPNRQKYSYDPLQWIQFLDYSAKKETIEAAIKYFEKGLKNKTYSVNSAEAEELFYFYDLIMLVPDIVKQLDSQQNFLLVPNNSASQFEKNLNELRTQYKIDKLPISSEMKISEIKHYLVKIQQQYPTIKCEITANDESVRFHGPNFNLIQAAKYQLECFLGLREIVTVSQDRFEFFSSAEGPKMEASPRDPTSTDGMNDLVNSQNRIFSTDAQNTEETPAESCFTMKDGFLVKIYQGNILKSKVDGIVNAANKHLSHGAGVAGAIIKAAGEAVNKEGQNKLSTQPLNEGDVLTTSAGNLTQYKCIIHAVGPRYRINQDDYCRAKIAETIYNTLTEANKLNLFSIALPAISSAIFGVPMDICTNGYFQGVMQFCMTRSQSAKLKEVHFVDMNSSRIKAIELHFARQLKTTGNMLADNFVQNPKKENPADVTVKIPEKCPVCFEEKPDLNRLKCKHICCLECVKKLSQAICPTCRLPFGIVYGDQPDGIMRVTKSHSSLPGYTFNMTYEINYSLSTRYDQTLRHAYLPVCKKGDLILKMLQLAFERRLIFTVGESRSSGQHNVITWNEIHHKTSRYNSQYDSFGYPDPNYFTRVTDELASKGITQDSVSNRTIKRSIEMRSGKVYRTDDFY